MHLQGNPIPTHSLFLVIEVGIPFKQTTIRLDGTAAAHVVFVTCDEDKVDAALFSFRQRKPEHAFGVSLAALVRTDGITDMPAILRKELIQPMPQI